MGEMCELNFPRPRTYNAETKLDQFDIDKDYYAIVGAREDDSACEIERLYKRQAHKWHPDRGGTEEEMKALNEAYRVLRDAQTGRVYDSHRQRSVQQRSVVRV